MYSRARAGVDVSSAGTRADLQAKLPPSLKSLRIKSVTDTLVRSARKERGEETSPETMR